MHRISRRAFSFGALGLLTGSIGARAISREIAPSGTVAHPPFWQLRKGPADVTLLGFGDAKDKSWLSPALRQAVEASDEIWLETPPQSDQVKPDPAAFMQMMKYMNLQSGTLFDRLGSPLAERLKARASELGLVEGRIAKLQPWWAYYQVNGAWWAKHPPAYQALPVDRVLEELANQTGKSVRYEFASFPDFARFMSAMPDKAQSQYLQWLLDTQDARADGRGEDPFAWMTGKRPQISLRRMKALPDLYTQMQLQRNQWWADKIVSLLDQGRKAFVAVGQLHVMGEDGIPARLARIGYRPRSKA